VGFTNNMVSTTLRKSKLTEVSELDPWKLFLNAMRSPMTRDRYSTRVAKFFDFIEMPGRTLEQKAGSFARKGKNDTDWAFSIILKFIYFQRERVEKKEISGATVINYTKSIKLFCDMADITIAWKKITHGPQRLNVSVVLARDQERILANANNIDDYVLRLRELCDFQKKKPCFVYIPDANLYHEFEEDFIELIHPSSPMSIVTKQLNSRLKPEPDFTRTLKFSKELS
jgi:hypothetical protein